MNIHYLFTARIGHWVIVDLISLSLAEFFLGDEHLWLQAYEALSVEHP